MDRELAPRHGNLVEKAERGLRGRRHRNRLALHEVLAGVWGADVLTVLRAAVGIAPLSPDQLQSLRRLHPGAGDHADISDVLALLRAVLGMGG